MGNKRVCSSEEMQRLQHLEHEQSTTLDPLLTLGCVQPYGNAAFAQDALSETDTSSEDSLWEGMSTNEGVEWTYVGPGEVPWSEAEVDTSEPQVSQPERTSTEPQGAVEFCEQTARVKGMRELGIQHHWLRTPNREAGLGPAPGANIEYGADVQITDHSGRGDSEGAHCTPVYQHHRFGHPVDLECVDDKLTPGRDMGQYGFTNQCQSTIADIVAACRAWDDPDFVTDPDPYERYTGERSSGAGGSGH